MAKYRAHCTEFKRRAAQGFICGETLHTSPKRYDISRQLVQIWVGKFEAGVTGQIVSIFKGAF